MQKCARYAETSLKILSVLKNSEQSPNGTDIDDLITVSTAQIRYLQEEYAGIIIDSKYGHDTAQTFRALQRNTSIFPQSVLDRVETAVNLTSLNRDRDRRGGRGNRGRGWYFSGRGYSRNNQYRGTGRGYNPYQQYTYGAPEEERS